VCAEFFLLSAVVESSMAVLLVADLDMVAKRKKQM